MLGEEGLCGHILNAEPGRAGEPYLKSRKRAIIIDEHLFICPSKSVTRDVSPVTSNDAIIILTSSARDLNFTSSFSCSMPTGLAIRAPSSESIKDIQPSTLAEILTRARRR